MKSKQGSNSYKLLLYAFVLLQAASRHSVFGLLYPRESESREVKDLSGRWKFRIDNSHDRNESFREEWWKKPLKTIGKVIDMPVPASYNDITQDRSIRDFTGWAWYETSFYVPSSWSNGVRVWLQVGSAHYAAIVWMNSVKVTDHVGGHLPFECDVTKQMIFGAANRLTIAVNNTLTAHTLPPGTIKRYSTENGYPEGYFTQEYEFDFFNYAGIHRPVKLYTTPSLRVSDIFVHTSEITQNPAIAAINNYQVNVTDARDIPATMKHSAGYNVTVMVKDADGKTVANSSGQTGTLMISIPRLWWPVGMSEDVGYLYTLEVYASALSADRAPVQTDVYRMRIGLRTVKVDGTQLKINGKPFYFLGVGKHEDWDVRGKGFDWSMVTKDFNLLEWLGANSFRTSHYPYAEEIMQMCDERGIVVIDECPAVGMRSANNFVNATLSHHLQVVREMVSRDRNHPSVVMWSVANEPASNLPQAADYFKTVLNYARSLDATRPVTFVCNAHYDVDVATPYVDVVSINKYEGWYSDPGHLEVVSSRLMDYITKWHQTRSKPIIHMEWGAGAIAGFHANPSAMFTEDYLVDLMGLHFTVFDELRNNSNPYFIGEMIWNFADFATAQATTRVHGNKKGLLTRGRQPKWPAYIIKDRYRALQNQSAGSCGGDIRSLQNTKSQSLHYDVKIKL